MMSNNDRRVTVSVVQAGSVLFDNHATLVKLADFTKRASAAGSKIVLFPEAFIGGYPKGQQFGVSLGKRSDEGREEFVRYFENAIEVPGPESESIGVIARDHQVYLVTGVIERSGGTLFCTVLFFGPSGDLLAKHRKLMPTALERVLWGCGDGSTLPVLETPHGKVGAVICWENYMPLLRTAMYAKGIEIYCAPTVDDREMWIPTVRHIAYEGRCFVLSACQVLEQASDSQSGTASPKLIRGGSCIISPFGELIAGPVYCSEQILTAEIDLKEISRGKFDLDVVGHYARPDVFQLQVNEAPQPIVNPFAPKIQ